MQVNVQVKVALDTVGFYANALEQVADPENGYEVAFGTGGFHNADLTPVGEETYHTINVCPAGENVWVTQDFETHLVITVRKGRVKAVTELVAAELAHFDEEAVFEVEA